MATRNDVYIVKEMLSAKLLTTTADERHVLNEYRNLPLSRKAMVAPGKGNIHAVGIGRQPNSDSLVVRVYVEKKLPNQMLSKDEKIPSSIDGVPTTVIQSSAAFINPPSNKHNTSISTQHPSSQAGAHPCSKGRQTKQRPVKAGISCGHPDITAGTIACFCTSSDPNDPPDIRLVLSNNHVLANVNNANLGDIILQPGPLDAGSGSDRIGKLHRYEPIVLGGQTSNYVDAAVAVLDPDLVITNSICSIGTISGHTNGTEGMVVQKHGRTTGLTLGEIDDESLDVLVGMDDYNPNVVGLFKNQLRISGDTAFGLGGDSGSLVVEKDTSKAVGLYFAGPENGEYGLANPIGEVLRILKISI